MDFHNTLFLILHIVAGYLGLSTGTLIMIMRKGNKKHRNFGNIYHLSMQVVAFTALYLGVAKNLVFLFHVGLFVLYLNSTGRLVMGPWHKDKKRTFIAISIVGMANAVIMLLTLNPILMVFAGITLFNGYNDVRWLTTDAKTRVQNRTREHIGRMVGSYISAITAFLVVNVSIEPGWLIWILPTVIFTPLIVIWVIREIKTQTVS